MAKKEHWEVDPFNWNEVFERTIGAKEEDSYQSKLQVRQILDGIPGGLRCLEIGAGYGRLLPRMLISFHQAFGVDSSCSMVALSTLYLRHEICCRIILGDGTSLPYPEDTFDFVYSFTCFQHMEDIETVRANLYGAYRVLVPGGWCKIQTVMGDPEEVGKYDGRVFRGPVQFAVEFERAGFKALHWMIDQSKQWIWVTARKERHE